MKVGLMEQLAQAERLCWWGCRTLAASREDLRVLLRAWRADYGITMNAALIEAIADNVHAKANRDALRTG